MSIQRHQEMRSYSSKRLRRARRLYFRLCAPAVLSAVDNDLMVVMTRKMIERGLYAHNPATSIPFRDFRFKIVRHLYWMKTTPEERKRLWHWMNWCRANGFDGNMNRIKPIAQTA